MLKYGKIIKSSWLSPKKNGFTINLKAANADIFNLDRSYPNSPAYFRDVTPLTSRTAASPIKKSMKWKHLPQTSCYVMSNNNK